MGSFHWMASKGKVMFSVIQTTGYVEENGSIVLSGNFPEKERVRYAHHDYPTGTKLKVEMLYQKDNFHGKDFHDYLLKSFEPIKE